MKNVHKIKIKLENIWIDLIMGIYAPYTHCLNACMSHVAHAGAIAFMMSTVSIKNGSIVGHRLNHCAFFGLVQPRGQGNFPVCDSGGSPAINGSLIPRRFTRCSSTSLHRNPTDGSPWGGRSMLGDGPETLFFMQGVVLQCCL